MGDEGGDQSQALAAAIHETTNALTVILGWIERARDASDGQPEASTALRRAARYTRTARHAMRRAIGAEVPTVGPEPALDLAVRISEDLATEAKRRDVSLGHVVSDEATDFLVGHPEVAWQILTNLLLNAIAHTPAKASVTLHVDTTSDGIAFQVHDEGSGVAPDQRANLFASGVSRRPGGAGVGLRHAYDLARECGGKLSLLDSDVGAHFELRWPTTDDVPTAQPPSVRPAPNARGLDGSRVLLLEDDAAVIELLELSLGSRGADVTTVATAEALAVQLDTGNYDVMLVDLSPLSTDGAPTEDSGLDAAIARAKSANPDIDVVVISGSVTVQPRPDIVWVRKPFEPRELVAAIVRRRGA
jgi:CheY-like chemotaxis protein